VDRSGCRVRELKSVLGRWGTLRVDWSTEGWLSSMEKARVGAYEELGYL